MVQLSLFLLTGGPEIVESRAQRGLLLTTVGYRIFGTNSSFPVK